MESGDRRVGHCRDYAGELGVTFPIISLKTGTPPRYLSA